MEPNSAFEKMLNDINAFLDNPPLRGSPGHQRFNELVEAMEQRRAEVSRGPFADQLLKLDLRIKALVQRRALEQHSHDLSTGAPGTVAFLGWDFRHADSAAEQDRPAG